ncbi:MAG: bifunctional precorrin-2 dehydrogenase/sirohydrochlorin ferrochelatase [Alicyclobacillus sp.]|nr:bifunctional precorrin-2 dehydrogenase/sirohydrochlorin ferrochelatase [Alicyclobacillus sp.]
MPGETGGHREKRERNKADSTAPARGAAEAGATAETREVCEAGEAGGRARTTGALYPAALDVRGRLCVVIGGGRVAERKVKGLLESGARVRVVSPELTPALADCAVRGQLEWVARAYQPGDVEGAWLVFAATDDPAVNRQVQADAERAERWVNVADNLALCSFQVPARVRRGPLLVAISTSGTDPAGARRLRQLLEEHLDTGSGSFAEEARRVARGRSPES